MFCDLDWPLNASRWFVTLTKRFLRFYKYHGPYTLDKTSKVFIFNICCFYTTSVVLMFLFSSSLHLFSIFKIRPSVILDFKFFAIFVKDSNLRLFLCPRASLVKIGWSAAELLRIFDFQNGDRPPSWIWYDVISDHPRLVFDGPNILLKLHVDRDILQRHYIAIYSAGLVWNCIFTPLFGKFFGDVTPNEFQKDCPCAKSRRISHKPWKFTHGFDLGTCPRKKIQYNLVTRKKVTKQ